MASPVLLQTDPPTDLQSSQDIDSTNVRIYYASRSWAFLCLLLAGILVVSVMLGRHLQKVSPAPGSDESFQVLQGLLHEKRPDFHAVTAALLQAPTSSPVKLAAALQRSDLSVGARLVVAALGNSLLDGLSEPTAQLLILAHQVNPEPGANDCVAELYLNRGELWRAREYFAREMDVAPNAATRRKIIATLERSGNLTGLVSLGADPAYAALYPASLRAQLALFRHDWILAGKSFLQMQLDTLRVQPAIMAFAAGLAWLLIALHAGQPHALLCFRTIAPVIAAVLGIAAGLAGQFLTVAQRELLDIGETGMLHRDVGYYTGVVVPRDLLLKFFAILPFLPSLMGRRSALDTLVVTGCVGLGFAIPGNLELCKYVDPADSLGRLLTANFFHFAATALVGYAGYRCLTREKGSVRSAAGVLAAVVVTMGVYETFTRITGAYVPMIIATIAFLILSRVFFMELRKWRDSFTDQCFLGATLVVSLAALVGTMLIAAAMQTGFDQASLAVIRNLPNLLLVGLVFFAQFKRGFAAIGSELTAPAQQ